MVIQFSEQYSCCNTEFDKYPKLMDGPQQLKKNREIY